MKIKEKNKKLNFTNKFLFSLCSQIDEDIIDMQYLIATPSNEEYVYITFKDYYRKRICVTADSLKAMTCDVLKEI